MSVLSMPCLPDCAVCGGQVVVDTDLDGGVEVCTGCGIAQPVPGVWDRAEIRRRVRVVAALAKRGELP